MIPLCEVPTAPVLHPASPAALSAPAPCHATTGEACPLTGSHPSGLMAVWPTTTEGRSMHTEPSTPAPPQPEASTPAPPQPAPAQPAPDHFGTGGPFQAAVAVSAVVWFLGVTVPGWVNVG